MSVVALVSFDTCRLWVFLGGRV